MATQRYVLIGPHAGKDMVIGDHRFENGEFTFTGGQSQIEPLTRFFSNWGALPELEAELLELRAEKAASEALQQAVQQQAPPAEVLAPVAPPAEVVPPAETVPPVTPPPAEEQKPSLAEAIGLLDPENDDHWTSNNLPALDYLEKVTGLDVGRAAVEEVAKGYTRAKARAARQ